MSAGRCVRPSRKGATTASPTSTATLGATLAQAGRAREALSRPRPRGRHVTRVAHAARCLVRRGARAAAPRDATTKPSRICARAIPVLRSADPRLRGASAGLPGLRLRRAGRFRSIRPRPGTQRELMHARGSTARVRHGPQQPGSRRIPGRRPAHRAAALRRCRRDAQLRRDARRRARARPVPAAVRGGHARGRAATRLQAATCWPGTPPDAHTRADALLTAASAGSRPATPPRAGPTPRGAVRMFRSQQGATGGCSGPSAPS